MAPLVLTDDTVSYNGCMTNPCLRTGTYYLITSHKTGWNPNPLIAWRSTTTSLDTANWTSLGNPTRSPTSFNSQPTYVVSYTPSSGEPYFVYMGDDWVRCPNLDGTEGPLVNACYIWLPIRMYDEGAGPHGLPLQIDYRRNWSLNDPFSVGVLKTDDDLYCAVAVAVDHQVVAGFDSTPLPGGGISQRVRE